MEQNKKLFGYAGKILRINLTNQTTEIIPTAKYLPDYIGGRAIADKIYWDEFKEPVPALDPRNVLIYMTGPCAATGLPISGRAIITGISAKNLPEQYTHSSIGGYFGSMLKWAGYDGFILEGKAAGHTYVNIVDDKVEFLSADGLWGKFVTDTQNEIFRLHGSDAYSLVIGPAGENLHRCASIVTHADSAAAKTGFGAVMGSKNLKAIVVRGTGTITAAYPERVLELRNRAGDPKYQPSPMTSPEEYYFPFGHGSEKVPEGRARGMLCCNQGCNHPCMSTQFNLDDVLSPGEKISMVGKCLDPITNVQEYDSHSVVGAAIHSHRQEKFGTYNWMVATNTDPDDPMLQYTLERYPGDQINVAKNSLRYGNTINWLCNQYGLDKWDITVWYMTWLSMCEQEGLFEDLDFGRPVKLSDPDFAKFFIDSMVYRTTPLGNIFAEGMARAIRTLGKEKYGDTIYTKRFNTVTGERLDIPVSLESSWGESSHWQGRGFQGCHKFVWVCTNMTDMIGSRDEICGQHFHDWVENYLQYKDDPCHSPLFMKNIIRNNELGILKDTLLLCEYKSPTPYWDEMEAELYVAATGNDGVTKEDLLKSAERTRLLERAIFMRNHGRTRDMEVENVYPFMTYPDPFGNVMTWTEWNDGVDLYYENSGWQKKTGWPLRATWDKYGLSEVADELQALGKVPVSDDPDYVRKENPFDR